MVKRVEPSYPEKKVGSNSKRREHVYKRAAKAQRDLFRKRKRSGMSVPAAFVKKAAASNIQACGDVAAELGFEPRQTESESVVLPLHNSAIFKQR